jgi:hypothetical protein
MAQSEADDMAHRHFDSGTAYMEQADYEDALREFQKAYELSGRAEMLINIATAQERLGDLAAAVDSLDRYLKLEPEGDHSETIRIRAENLRKQLEAQRESEPEPTAEPAEPPSAPPPAQPTADTGSGSGSSNLPAWILFGVAGASAIGAGVTGAVALGEHSSAKSSCSPTCTDDQLATGRTMALTSTVLTGVAAVAAGVGIVLVLTHDDGEATASTVAVGVRGSPGSAMATTTIGF